MEEAAQLAEPVEAPVESQLPEKEPEIVAVAEPVKKCRIVDVFRSNFLGLMQDAPNNPMVRAHILKVILVPPPETEDTYEKLKEWIEWNYTPTAKVANQHIYRGMDAERPTLTVSIDSSRTVIGRCQFEARQDGSGEVSLNLNLIASLAEDASGLDDLYDLIRDEVNGNIDFDYETNEDSYSYTGYDTVDTHSEESDFVSYRHFKEQVQAFLLNHLPNEAERFGL